ncbi:hypothetical protein JR316_0005412 [Psilocybe cubensis]|uniref:DUF6534 domain-containing protein n=2 Tax=Psilocybe cubensis TaxID=181762 RepID=A0A8H8CEY2_PSICU|nr:hypothetical protein JR316_0005412 [Psilocybe cubensis]KAH9483306.1 hypothetical protein JR316_0005412 [Psilocybe cubensis]
MVRDIQPSTFRLESNVNLGAIQITTFLSLILFGIFLSQAYAYFSTNGDNWKLKTLVVSLVFLESSHSFTAAQTIYYDTVTRFKVAQPNSYPLSTTVALETLVTVVVQASAHASKAPEWLSSRVFPSVACLGLSLLRFIGGIVLTVESFMDVPKNENGLMFVFTFSWLITASLACGGAADVLIAGLMLFHLRKLSSPMNHTSTTEVINRLVRWSLRKGYFLFDATTINSMNFTTLAETGLITSLTSMAVIILFQAMGDMIWFGLYILLAKIYSNSLLASLNARPTIHARHRDQEAPISTMIQFSNSVPISVSFRTGNHDQATTDDLPPPVPSKVRETDDIIFMHIYMLTTKISCLLQSD